MRKFIIDTYLLIYVALLFTGLFIYFKGEHGATVLWLNQRHNPVFDISFKWITYLGDGIVFGLAVAILLIIKWRSGLVLLIMGITQTIISFVMKRVIFPGTPRPKTYFGIDDLHFVEGVKVHAYNSFPSGHTLTAFGLATFLAYYVNNQKLALLLLITAVLVGISRVYLLQHFLIDICIGSVIGVLLGLLFQKYDQRINQRHPTA